jgi:hypothetical protein
LDPALPAALRVAINLRLEGRPREDLARRAGDLSEGYRKGRASSALVRGAEDALAYALTRTPATYAAVRRALEETQALDPGFSPSSLLDAGAGPGGAGWAALDAFPGISEVTRLDHNAAFLDLAGALAGQGPEALAGARRLQADFAAGDLPAESRADLVIAAYALTEIAPGALPGAIGRLWGATGSRILIVEPGTPEGWRRGLEIRRELVAQGARILAPCPHSGPCPIAAPDWCHFSQRLPRSRDHRRAKGGEAPFEDEKFFWIAAARAGPHPPALPVSRVIAPPRTSKTGVRLRLCRPDGTVADVDFPRRDRAALARVRRLDWGDALPEDGPPGVGGQ